MRRWICFVGAFGLVAAGLAWPGEVTAQTLNLRTLRIPVGAGSSESDARPATAVGRDRSRDPDARRASAGRGRQDPNEMTSSEKIVVTGSVKIRRSRDGLTFDNDNLLPPPEGRDFQTGSNRPTVEFPTIHFGDGRTNVNSVLAARGSAVRIPDFESRMIDLVNTGQLAWGASGGATFQWRDRAHFWVSADIDQVFIPDQQLGEILQTYQTYGQDYLLALNTLIDLPGAQNNVAVVGAESANFTTLTIAGGPMFLIQDDIYVKLGVGFQTGGGQNEIFRSTGSFRFTANGAPFQQTDAVRVTARRGGGPAIVMCPGFKRDIGNRFHFFGEAQVKLFREHTSILVDAEATNVIGNPTGAAALAVSPSFQFSTLPQFSPSLGGAPINDYLMLDRKGWKPSFSLNLGVGVRLGR